MANTGKNYTICRIPCAKWVKEENGHTNFLFHGTCNMGNITSRRFHDKPFFNYEKPGKKQVGGINLSRLYVPVFLACSFSDNPHNYASAGMKAEAWTLKLFL